MKSGKWAQQHTKVRWELWRCVANTSRGCRTRQEPTVPLQSPIESVSEVEKVVEEFSEQTTTAPASTREAETLMKEAEILTGGWWDPDNTQGFSMLK